MSNELEARVSRLERALAHGVGVNIAEHDDADQAEARAKQDAADAKEGDKALAAAAAELDPTAEEVAATEAAAALAEEHGVNLADVEPTGASGQVTVPDVREHIAAEEA